jgi:MoaA/NifB/PqqE/SkfB family radical SAM enzyme
VARDFEVARNVDLTDGACGGWLLGPDCDVCGNYEFINQAWADLERTGLVRFLHRPAARTDAPDAAGGFADLVRESGAWPADDAAARRLVAGIERAARAEGESAALRLLGTIAGKPLVGPRWFIVEIINACNANCLYCNIHNPDRRPDPEWRKQRLSLADFRRIADDLAAIGGEGITLLANGEPLLHPEFPAMMRLAREKGLAVGFFTNGTLLTGALASEAVALGVAEINVTVSAATPETYARLHHSLGPADFDRAIASVRFLRARRDAAGAAVPRLVMVNVVTGPSAGEVEAMIRLAADAGFDEVRFQMVRLDDFNRALALTPDQLTGLRTAWPSIEKAARERGVALWPGFAPQLFATADETGDWEADRYVRHGCFVGYHLGLVKANGDFSFCCVVKPLANLRDVSLAEAWRSETYAKARHAALDLARRGDLRLADGTTLLSDRCRRCDNHDVNRLAHEALTRYGLWEFVGAVPPEDGR